MNQAGADIDVVAVFMNIASLGATWVMWLLVGLMFFLGAIILERACLFCRTGVDAALIGRELVVHLQDGRLEDAKKLVSRGLAAEERVVADGLTVWARGPRAVEQIMKASLVRERQRFERSLGLLGTVGSNAPFIGLLGTVIGIVISFEDLAANPKGGMAVVGAGIAEALASTAIGLVVAIPAVIAFNTFKGVLEKRAGNVEFLTGVVLSQLEEEH